jgi:3-oxoacyl-[acyl-carrier protein] reductase
VSQNITDAFSLKGKVAVVTGAAAGIGREAALIFAQAGAAVVASDVDQRGLAETAQLIAEVNGVITTLVTDVSKQAQVEQLAQQACAIHQRIDVWANVAGCLGNGSILDTSEADVDRVIGINLKGVYWGCAAAARVMQAQGHGAIINISSNGADSAPAGMAMYAMTKSGVNALTRSVAREMGPYGIRVNTISPGFVETTMAKWSYRRSDGEIDELQREKALVLRRQASPLGLLGEPRDIGLAMLYLASDASRFVTGQNFRINGGVSMS